MQARRFYFNENKFLDRFHGLDHAHAVPDRAYAAVRSVNSVAWRAWMVVGLVLMVFPFTPGSHRDYRMPLLFKGLAGIVALQPIVLAAVQAGAVALVAATAFLLVCEA